MKNFDYPYTTIEEQIEILKKKGLIINDETKAKEVLSNIGYSKFFSYLHPYLSTLENGEITFETVYNSFKFDTKIRLIFFEYISHIELWLKVKFVEFSCEKQKEKGIDDPNIPVRWIKSENIILSEIKDSIDKYCELGGDNILEQNLNNVLNNIKKSCNINDEDFGKIKKSVNRPNIKLYLGRYNNPKYPPIRNIVEDLTLGEIIQLIKDSNIGIYKKFFKICDMDIDSFFSALKLIVDIRNICCHNGRLYNNAREFHKKLKEKISIKLGIDNLDNYPNFFSIFSLIKVFLSFISIDIEENFSSSIQGKIKEFKKEYLLIKK